MIKYVAEKINQLKGVARVDCHNGVICPVITGVNPELREEVLDICRRAMLPVKVQYQLEDGALVTHDQLVEFHLPLVSYSNAVINNLGVRGPLEPDRNWYQPIQVDGALGEPKMAPPDEVVNAKDGAEKLKRLRANTRGRPVVGWKLGDRVVRKGDTLKAIDHCPLQWTMGRVINVRPGMTAKVTELSSRRPIAYADLGEYSGVEIPVHMLGKMFDLVTNNGKIETTEREGEVLQKTAPEFYQLFGIKDIRQPDLVQLEDEEEEDLLLPPSKDPLKKKFKKKK